MSGDSFAWIRDLKPEHSYGSVRRVSWARFFADGVHLLGIGSESMTEWVLFVWLASGWASVLGPWQDEGRPLSPVERRAAEIEALETELAAT